MNLQDTKHILLSWIATNSHSRATTAALNSWLYGKSKLHRKAMYVVVLDRHLVELTKTLEESHARN